MKFLSSVDVTLANTVQQGIIVVKARSDERAYSMMTGVLINEFANAITSLECHFASRHFFFVCRNNVRSGVPDRNVQEVEG